MRPCEAPMPCWFEGGADRPCDPAEPLPDCTPAGDTLPPGDMTLPADMPPPGDTPLLGTRPPPAGAALPADMLPGGPLAADMLLADMLPPGAPLSGGAVGAAEGDDCGAPAVAVGGAAPAVMFVEAGGLLVAAVS